MNHSIPDDSPNRLEIKPRPKGITRFNKRLKLALLLLIGVAAIIFYHGYQQRTQPVRYEPQQHIAIERLTSPLDGGWYGDGILAEQPEPERETVVIDNTRDLAIPEPTTDNDDRVSELDEQVRQWREQKMLEALEAPTLSAGLADMTPAAFTAMAGTPASLTAAVDHLGNDLDQAAANVGSNADLAGFRTRLAALQQGLQNGTLVGGNPAAQPTRRSFYADHHRFGTLNHSMTPAQSTYELQSGSVIPCVLQTAVNSDLAGELVCLVSENVYDSATGRHRLIPFGSRLVGAYDSNLSYAQERLLAGWYEINFPNGSKLSLGGMSATDALGRAGLSGQVNHHLGRLILGAALASLFQVGYELSRGNDARSTVESAASEAIGQQVSQVGLELAQRQLDVPPTIDVDAGTRINVLVRKNVVFQTPYRD